MLLTEIDGQEPVNKPIVYVDLDGVLADFFGGVEKLYGVDHWKQLVSDKTKDLKMEVINKIQGTDFFATLPKLSLIFILYQLYTVVLIHILID